MSDETIITPDNHNGSGNGAGGDGADISKLPLNEALSKVLGKEFPDAQTAIKAVKDTFDFVGKAGKGQKALEAVMQARGLDEESAIRLITSELGVKNNSQGGSNNFDEKKFVPREEFEQSQFYSERQELRPYKGLIETFLKANPGKTRAEVLELPEFKDSFEKVKAQDEGKQKSILHSNQRVGKGADKMTQAQDSLKSGDKASAEKSAVQSVMETFEI